MLFKFDSYPRFVKTIVRPVFKSGWIAVEENYKDYHIGRIYKLTTQGIQRFLKITIDLYNPYTLLSLDKHQMIVFSNGYNVGVYSVRKRETIQQTHFPKTLDVQGIKYIEHFDALAVIGREAIYIYEIGKKGTLENVTQRIEPYLKGGFFGSYALYDRHYLFLLLQPSLFIYYDEETSEGGMVYMGILEIQDLYSSTWKQQMKKAWKVNGEPYLSVFPKADRICCKTMKLFSIYKYSDQSFVYGVENPGYYLVCIPKLNKIFFNKEDFIVSLTL